MTAAAAGIVAEAPFAREQVSAHLLPVLTAIVAEYAAGPKLLWFAEYAVRSYRIRVAWRTWAHRVPVDFGDTIVLNSNEPECSRSEFLVVRDAAQCGVSGTNPMAILTTLFEQLAYDAASIQITGFGDSEIPYRASGFITGHTLREFGPIDCATLNILQPIVTGINAGNTYNDTYGCRQSRICCCKLCKDGPHWMCRHVNDVKCKFKTYCSCECEYCGIDNGCADVDGRCASQGQKCFSKWKYKKPTTNIWGISDRRLS